MRDITFAFIKSASNRQAEDAGRKSFLLNFYIAMEGPGAAGGKKGGKKKGGK